jgi:hypothetical protein
MSPCRENDKTAGGLRCKPYDVAACLWETRRLFCEPRGASNAVRGDPPSNEDNRHAAAASRVVDPMGGITNGQDHTCRQL